MLTGMTMFEKRIHFMNEFDWIRKGLMFEPRGNDMMSGSMLYPPCDPENDFGILFIETSGCLPMCGHSTIGTITVAIEEGLVAPKTAGILNIEAPAGLIRAHYGMEGKKVKWVRFTNVASFLARQDLDIESPHLGKITFDVAYGGNYYAIIDHQENFRGIENYTAEQLIVFSRPIRQLINEKYSFIHPENPKIAGVSHVQWTGKTLSEESHARNAVFYGDKAIDRSPCGTGTSARMAQWYGRNKLQVGDKFIHESIIGSKFIGRVESKTRIGAFDAIIPSIEGWARVFGYNTIMIDDEDDPFAFGFQVI